MFSRVPLAACLVLGLVFSAYGEGVNRRAAAVPQIQLVPIQLTGLPPWQQENHPQTPR